MLNWLSIPIVGAMIGIIGTLIGTSLSIIFYVRSKIIAKPRYTIENIKLIHLEKGVVSTDISILYKDIPLVTLNKTIIRFMNAGKKTIDKNDIVPDYLSIDFGGNNASSFHILEIKISDCSRDAILVETKNEKPHLVEFRFNYLDCRDYITIDIIHSGDIIPSSIGGNIKGVPSGLLNISYKAEKRVQAIIDSFSESVIKAIIKSILGYYR